MRPLPEVEDLAVIIAAEEARCRTRINNHIRHILVKEFRRVAKKYQVRKVIFGNGTCLIQWRQFNSLTGPTLSGVDLPLGLQRLGKLCHYVADTYPPEDITEADLQ